MSVSLQQYPSILRNLILVSWLLFPVMTSAQAAPCDTWSLESGEMFRHAGGDIGDVACFQLDITQPALLALEAITAIDAPRVRLLLDAEPLYRVLRATVSLRLLQAGIGTYRLRVTTEDPNEPLPAFRLSVRTAPFVFEGLDKGETDTELEIDPPPSGGPISSGTLLEPAVPESGDSGETDTELEIDPPPSLRSAPLWPPSFEALCLRDERDDHADDGVCATSLTVGAEVTGEIANAHGDDRDAFRFRVDELSTVELRVAGEAEFCMELVDAVGQRLDVRWSREGGSLSAFATLVRGDYELRLEGCGGGLGEYGVSLELPSL